MWRRKKQVEPDEVAGAPEWMVTFSDCMTLMLTFFVLLFSFSSFDEGVFEELSMSLTKAMSAAGPLGEEKDKSAFLPTKQIVSTEYLGVGSEKPTLEEEADEHLRKETEDVNFRRSKVFLFASEEIFLGKVAAISSEGREVLADMATFLRDVPGRVVISENGPYNNKDGKNPGLLRAWAVLDYLVTRQGLDKKWFSISAATTLTQANFENNQTGQAKRRLEIVLLERSIYN